MKARKAWALVAGVAVLLFPSAVLAGWSGFLRLDGVPGESQNVSHVGWIDVSAATSANIINSSITQGVASGHGTLQALAITKNIDAASSVLALMCAKGRAIATGTLDLATTNTAAPVLRLELQNIYVSSVTQSNNTDGTFEQVLLQPQIVQWYYAQSSTNTGLLRYLTSQWNISTATGSAGIKPPTTVTAGIRVSNGVELSWNAVSGKNYCIFAVPQLGMPFTPLASQTVTNTGIMTFNMSATNNALFYVVEELP